MLNAERPVFLFEIIGHFCSCTARQLYAVGCNPEAAARVALGVRTVPAPDNMAQMLGAAIQFGENKFAVPQRLSAGQATVDRAVDCRHHTLPGLAQIIFSPQ